MNTKRNPHGAALALTRRIERLNRQYEADMRLDAMFGGVIGATALAHVQRIERVATIRECVSELRAMTVRRLG